MVVPSLQQFEDGTYQRLVTTQDCSDVTKVIELLRVRDYYLNNNKLPEGDVVTREELIALTQPLVHSINTRNRCGNQEIIDEYYAKLGVSDFSEV